ncbi:protein OCTOPUS [Cajanus cajan]|uniref:protein OCTOPUS n=1 Tax=Cajanus cajan TaxID=3821 RepID=UPI00098DAF3F|nr:protein OCTOPUS [Cajanus cajan]
MNPPQPPQPHRPSTSCPRHPDENFTGFCPSCLCERLALLDPNTTPSPRKPPSSAAAAALKALFRPPPLPELRRTKSFSASKNEPSSSFEPQRKSCDVRVRNNTLSNLFHQDLNPPPQNDNPPQQEQEEDKDETRALEEPKPNVNEIEELEEGKVEKEELFGVVEEEEEEEEEFKTMKDHMEQDSSHAKQQKNRDFKDLAGSFFSAASVFSKKLQKWRQKQKAKKRRSALPVEKPIGRQFRDTQSEIADYGFGRRSCDTDPRFSLDAGRFSLDAGRMSFDDPRYSIEEPRASWDGYILGRTAALPRMPTMLSVVEDAPVPSVPVAPAPINHVVRTDMQIPVEEGFNEDESVPGGSAQTREYYSDSGSRRRKSLDRSSSVRKSVSLEVDELSNGSGGVSNNVNVNVNVNAKVAPAGAGVEYVQGVRMMGLNDRDRGEFGSNSMREDCCSEKMFDVGVIENGDGRKGGKKGRRWRWSIWGFIHRRGGNKDEDEDRYSRVNGVERSYSESWGGDGRSGGGGFNGRVLRSNSSVSWRNAQGIGNGGGGFGGFRRNGSVQGNGNGKKGKDEFVLERNRSARYSPNNIDNGLLRFYLTPMRGSRRNGSVKSRSNQAHSIARSVLGLY